MNDRHHQAWKRLAAAARRAPRLAETAEAEVEPCAPAGFATRVVARADLRPLAAGGGIFGRGFNRIAARGLGLACACAVAVAVWGGMPATAEARSLENGAPVAEAYLDPVGEYLAAVQS
jgi:hypothetical protein